ncbi:hypothetical protein Tco_0105680 [Tanacetum coccineum]
MLAPKCSTYNGRPTFANPRYLKKAQSDKPCLYEIPYDTSDPANRFAPDREGTMTLDNESRSKLNKDYVKPYDYTNQNSLYEIFKGPSLEYLYQLERTKEVRKTMWRKPDYFRVPTAHDMELLIKTLLMPLSIKSQNDSFRFEHELKTEMHEDFEYVKSLENEVDELESEKADFSNMYDLLIEECVSKDVTCSYLHSLSDLNAYAELQYVYLHKVKECEFLYDSIFHYWADACYGYRIAILQILIQSSYPLMEKDLAFNHLINELQFVLGARGIVCSVINLEPFVLEENERLKRTFSNHDISCRCGARLNCCDQFFPPSLSYVTIATKDHAVATASAQNDNGSLEAESIVRAASTSVRFRLSKRVPVQVFEEWKSDVQCLLLLK